MRFNLNGESEGGNIRLISFGLLMCVKTSQIHETKRGASTHFDYARSGNYQNVVETKLLIQNQTFVRDTVYLTESRLWLKAA